MRRRRFLALAALTLAGCDVSLARRLLLSGGSSAIPLPSLDALTSSPNGGNNPWMVPGAYRYGDVVVGGYVDGSGSVECFTYTESTATVGGPHTIHASFETDAHTSPALIRRSSDGKILAFYCLHNAGTLNLRVSSSADDPSAWGSATNLDSQLGGTRYTDLQVHELSDGTLFLFYRDEPSAGTDSRWCWSTSSDGGSTWAAQTVLYRINSTRSYVISYKDPASDRIHFVATNGASSGYTKLGHWRMDGLTLARTKSDGSTISASLPLTFTDVTEAYSGSGDVFMSHIAFGSDGHPVFVGWEALDYIYRRWTGSAWTGSVIAACGTGFSYNNDSSYQPWGIALDDGDPNTVWLMRDSGGNPSAWRYRTTDGGASFGGQNLGATGGEVHTMIPVRNPGSLRAYYPVGSWTDYVTWACGLTGIVE